MYSLGGARQVHVGWWVGKVWNACVGETHWRLGETSVLRGIVRQVAIEHNVIYNTRNKGPFTHSARRKKPNRNAASCETGFDVCSRCLCGCECVSVRWGACGYVWRVSLFMCVTQCSCVVCVCACVGGVGGGGASRRDVRVVTHQLAAAREGLHQGHLVGLIPGR